MGEEGLEREGSFCGWCRGYEDGFLECDRRRSSRCLLYTKLFSVLTFLFFPSLELLPLGTHGYGALTTGAASYLAMAKHSLGPTDSLCRDHMAPPGNLLGWTQDNSRLLPKPNKIQIWYSQNMNLCPTTTENEISTPGQLPLFTQLPGRQFQNSLITISR